MDCSSGGTLYIEILSKQEGFVVDGAGATQQWEHTTQREVRGPTPSQQVREKGCQVLAYPVVTYVTDT